MFLLPYILMNTFKNFTTIHFQLSKANVLEFVKPYVPNKTEDLNLGFFNMIATINESKILTGHISCKGKCKLDGKNAIQINMI